MPTEAMVYLNKVTAASTGNNLSLTSISGSYKTLLCVFNGQANSGNDVLYARMNNNSSAVYPYIGFYGTSGGAASAEYNAAFNVNNPATLAWLGRVINNSDSSARSVCLFYIHQYANSSYNKTWQSFSAGSNAVGKWAGAFGSTTAVTQVDIFTTSGFTAGSTVTLYGMSA